MFNKSSSKSTSANIQPTYKVKRKQLSCLDLN